MNLKRNNNHPRAHFKNPIIQNERITMTKYMNED